LRRADTAERATMLPHFGRRACVAPRIIGIIASFPAGTILADAGLSLAAADSLEIPF